ncbi:MAG: hypothetical protein O2924_04715 [Chloroflexi bacterium]|nr:hypothetical protein [Chloroflexota bacterium]
MLNVLFGLFVVYVVITAWQMRRAFTTKEPHQRLTEAKRLLFTTALGIPLLVGFILVS